VICVTGAQWVSLTRAGIAGFASKLLGARVEEADLDEDWNELLGSDKRDVGSMSPRSSCPSPAVQYTPESSPPCKRIRINSEPMERTIERDEGKSDGDSDDIPVITAVKSGNMDEMEPDTNANDGLTSVERLHAYAESQKFDGRMLPER